MQNTFNNNNNKKIVNIDDIPIPTTKARNFEELLERELSMKGMSEAVPS